MRERRGTTGEKEAGNPITTKRCKGLWVIRARVPLTSADGKERTGESTERGE